VQFLYEATMGLRAPGMFGCILADDMGLGKTLQVGVPGCWVPVSTGLLDVGAGWLHLGRCQGAGQDAAGGNKGVGHPCMRLLARAGPGPGPGAA
jgi:hypothetical protein